MDPKKKEKKTSVWVSKTADGQLAFSIDGFDSDALGLIEFAKMIILDRMREQAVVANFDRKSKRSESSSH